MRSDSVTVEVPAKINLALGVAPLGADSFHELITVFHAVSLFDTVTAKPGSDGVSLNIEGHGSETLPVDDSNLAVRAAKLLASHHGIDAERLGNDRALRVEEFVVSQLDKEAFERNGHRNTMLSGVYREIDRKFKPDDFLVSMDSRLANLIFYLLEPEADDGLVYWNFFDAYLERTRPENEPLIYPVYKLLD